MKTLSDAQVYFDRNIVPNLGALKAQLTLLKAVAGVIVFTLFGMLFINVLFFILLVPLIYFFIIKRREMLTLYQSLVVEPLVTTMDRKLHYSYEKGLSEDDFKASHFAQGLPYKSYSASSLVQLKEEDYTICCCAIDVKRTRESEAKGIRGLFAYIDLECEHKGTTLLLPNYEDDFDATWLEWLKKVEIGTAQNFSNEFLVYSSSVEKSQAFLDPKLRAILSHAQQEISHGTLSVSIIDSRAYLNIETSEHCFELPQQFVKGFKPDDFSTLESSVKYMLLSMEILGALYQYSHRKNMQRH